MSEILSIGELLDLGGSAYMTAYVPFSGLNYSGSTITGISGSAIGGNVDSAAVSSIASSYAESAASSKLDTSAFESYTASANPSYSGVAPIVVDNESALISLSATEVQLDNSMTAYTSGGSAFIGVAAWNSLTAWAASQGWTP